MAQKKPTENVFRRYRELLEDLQETKSRLESLERQIKEIETGGRLPTALDIPKRLRKTYEKFKALKGRATLDEIYKGRESEISRQGVRAQIMKLIDLRIVRQSGRGEFELLQQDEN